MEAELPVHTHKLRGARNRRRIYSDTEDEDMYARPLEATGGSPQAISSASHTLCGPSLQKSSHGSPDQGTAEEGVVIELMHDTEDTSP